MLQCSIYKNIIHEMTVTEAELEVGVRGGGSHVIISLHMFTLQQDVLLHPPLALTPSSPHQHQSQPPELQELTVVKCVLREHRGEIAAAAGLEMYQPKLKLLL